MYAGLQIKFFIAFGIILACLGTSVSGQQRSLYSQYVFNKYEFNPAYAGMDYSLSVTGVSRNQWSTLQGNPLNQNLNAHIPFYLWNGALGLSVDHQSQGAEETYNIKASFNYVFDSDYFLLSFGGGIGFLQSSLNGSLLRTPNGVYEGNIIEHNDPILPSGMVTGTSLQWSLGAYAIAGSFEGGISIHELPQHSYSLGGIRPTRTTHTNIFAQYDLSFWDFVDFSTSILLRSDFNETQLDVTGVAMYDKSFLGGVGLRGYSANSVDAIVLIAGMQVNKHVRVSYSYDLGISGLRTHHDGTHEFVVNYNLRRRIGAGLPPKIIYNPRFL